MMKLSEKLFYLSHWGITDWLNSDEGDDNLRLIINLLGDHFFYDKKYIDFFGYSCEFECIYQYFIESGHPEDWYELISHNLRKDMEDNDFIEQITGIDYDYSISEKALKEQISVFLIDWCNNTRKAFVKVLENDNKDSKPIEVLPNKVIEELLSRAGTIYIKDNNDDEAVTLWKKAAELGSTQAMLELAEYDPRNSWEYILKAANLGNIEAMLILARQYSINIKESDDEFNHENVKFWCQKAIDEGSEEAWIILGDLYSLSSNPNIHCNDTAFYCYTHVAENKFTPVFEKVAKSYRDGLGVKQDYKSALFWYEICADLNNYTAIVKIGDMYMHGLGVEKNEDTAWDYYKRASDLGWDAGVNSWHRMKLSEQGIID